MTDDADQFVSSDADTWPLTPRTRFVLWLALADVAAAIDFDLSAARDGTASTAEIAVDEDSMVLHDFPVPAHAQPREWWEQVLRAAERLAEAARTGPDAEPRTPAEEVVLCIATELGWSEALFDDLAMEDRHFARLRAQFDALDERDDDFDWPEVLPALTGDTDVEQLWVHEFDGIADPDNAINQALGIGDYRPQSWHRLFDRHVGEIELPDD